MSDEERTAKTLKTNSALFHLKEIKFEVTHDCLLNCVHCSSMSTAKSNLVMDWYTFKRILDEAHSMGVNKIAFSGGEPLLWKYIEDGVSKSSKYGIHTILYTTCNVPDNEKMMRNLYFAGLNRVVFSIFGTCPAEHEAITNHEGSYERTIRAAKYCASMGLKTEFHFVPLSSNYKILRQITIIAAESGVDRISVLRLVPQGRGCNLRDKQLSHLQNIELRNTINNLREKGFDIRLGSPYNFLMLRKNPQCRSGIDRMTIGPDFRIFPCDAFKHISPVDIGADGNYSNLRNHSLQECWEGSKYFEMIREYLMTDIAPECSTCSNFNKCKSGCMAQKFYSYNKLIKAPDPMCLNGANMAAIQGFEKTTPLSGFQSL